MGYRLGRDQLRYLNDPFTADQEQDQFAQLIELLRQRQGTEAETRRPVHFGFNPRSFTEQIKVVQ